MSVKLQNTVGEVLLLDINGEFCGFQTHCENKLKIINSGHEIVTCCTITTLACVTGSMCQDTTPQDHEGS